MSGDIDNNPLDGFSRIERRRIEQIAETYGYDIPTGIAAFKIQQAADALGIVHYRSELRFSGKMCWAHVAIHGPSVLAIREDKHEALAVAVARLQGMTKEPAT